MNFVIKEVFMKKMSVWYLLTQARTHIGAGVVAFHPVGLGSIPEGPGS